MPYIGVPTTVVTDCGKCPSQAVERQVWESSDGGFEDYHYTCKSCGHNWWVDGPDA